MTPSTPTTCGSCGSQRPAILRIRPTGSPRRTSTPSSPSCPGGTADPDERHRPTHRPFHRQHARSRPLRSQERPTASRRGRLGFRGTERCTLDRSIPSGGPGAAEVGAFLGPPRNRRIRQTAQRSSTGAAAPVSSIKPQQSARRTSGPRSVRQSNAVTRPESGRNGRVLPLARRSLPCASLRLSSQRIGYRVADSRTPGTVMSAR
jgi:hypothetical protein